MWQCCTGSGAGSGVGVGRVPLDLVDSPPVVRLLLPVSPSLWPDGSAKSGDDGGTGRR
jgi:hypothetical protein